MQGRGKRAQRARGWASIDTGANLVKERIYLGGFEIYREHESGAVRLERQTLHVMDGVRRVAMVETKTVDTSGPFTVTPRIRFQLDNHLGSAMLEVTGTGDIISYEEYHPYGTSAYRSSNGSVEVSARRYRYTGKERDEETGLYYYGARYYACWLGRWTSADPSGIGADGPGLYNYTRGSPVTLTDPNGRQSRGPIIVNPWETLDAISSLGGTLSDLIGNSFQEIAEEKQAQVAKFQRESEAEVEAGTRSPIDAGVDRFLFGVVASVVYLPGTFYEYVAETHSSYQEGGVDEVLYDKAAAPKETLGRFAAAVGAGDVAESIREGLNFGLEIFGIAAGASQIKIKPGVPGPPSTAYATAGGGSIPVGATTAALPTVVGVPGLVAGIAMSSAVGGGSGGGQETPEEVAAPARVRSP